MEGLPAGIGGGAGVGFDLNRSFRLFAEVPVEYFIGAEKGLDSVVVLFAAGVQVRM
ncbi:MAG: hypothetical protein HY897_04720 [Deltaproteobacteria bacterium]|nr:hypothetical protein [Deltaproteobacteria bacterium]